jgi:hypothetical protein
MLLSVLGAGVVIGTFMSLEVLLFGAPGLDVQTPAMYDSKSGPPSLFVPPLLTAGMTTAMTSASSRTVGATLPSLADTKDFVAAALVHLIGMLPAHGLAPMSSLQSPSLTPSLVPQDSPPMPEAVPLAGLPRFPRFFARDALISSLLLGHAHAADVVLHTLAMLQGDHIDSESGMEVGKVAYL